MLRRIEFFLLNILVRNRSSFVGLVILGFSQLRGRASRPSYRMRRAIDLAQPADPISRATEELPEIDIVTVTASDTFEFAETSLRAAIRSSRNPVRRVIAIVPDDSVPEAMAQIPSATILSEEELLPSKIFGDLRHFVPSGRQHWVLCQILGLYYSRQADVRGVLVVDADTFLIGRRTWLDSNKTQILSFSHEYHAPYEEHCERFLGPRLRHHGLSYVTHYMLFQPDILSQIFPDQSSFSKWILSGKVDSMSTVADYHTYGRWLVDNCPDRFKLAMWHNHRFLWGDHHGSTPTTKLESIRRKYRNFGSASCHRYLERI